MNHRRAGGSAMFTSPSLFRRGGPCSRISKTEHGMADETSRTVSELKTCSLSPGERVRVRGKEPRQISDVSSFEGARCRRGQGFGPSGCSALLSLLFAAHASAAVIQED